MQLGQTILYSKNKERLTSLLSHVFDLEADRKKDGIFIKFNNMGLFIKEPAKKQKPTKNFQTEMEFFVNTEEELLQIKEKIEFGWFKLTQEAIKIEEEKDSFRIYDFDSRPWKFSLREHIQ